MDPREQFMEDQAYHDERTSERQENIDAGVAAKIIRAFGRNPAQVRRIEADFSLSWLFEQHPEAPVKLTARHIRTWSMHDLFLRFTKTEIHDAFEDAIDCYSDQSSVGAVFHANVLGDMIVHNWLAPTFPGPKILPGKSARYGVLVIQQLKNFLPVYCERWEPQGYPLEVR